MSYRLPQHVSFANGPCARQLSRLSMLLLLAIWCLIFVKAIENNGTRIDVSKFCHALSDLIMILFVSGYVCPLHAHVWRGGHNCITPLWRFLALQMVHCVLFVATATLFIPSTHTMFATRRPIFVKAIENNCTHIDVSNFCHDVPHLIMLLFVCGYVCPLHARVWRGGQNWTTHLWLFLDLIVHFVLFVATNTLFVLSTLKC